MKNLAIIILSILSFTFASQAQVSLDMEMAKPTIDFEDQTINVGKIPQGTPHSVEFVVKNTSMVPLIISNVKASCGCTVPSWPKEPIKAGGEATIVATYNAKSMGIFNKSLTITSNAADAVERVYFKGEVVKPGAEAAK